MNVQVGDVILVEATVTSRSHGEGLQDMMTVVVVGGGTHSCPIHTSRCKQIVSSRPFAVGELLQLKKPTNQEVPTRYCVEVTDVNGKVCVRRVEENGHPIIKELQSLWLYPTENLERVP